MLPPAFLTKVLQRLRDDSLGVQVVRSVGELPLHQAPACSSSAMIGTNRLVECYMLRSKFSEYCAVHNAWMTNAVSSCQLTHLKIFVQGTCWAPSMRRSACSAAGRSP